ncbi:hypothetical protein PN481_07530 [Nodularia spumigena CS-588/06]|nr:hypothetical protein [Nodularia spumigena CS-588/06]
MVQQITGVIKPKQFIDCSGMGININQCCSQNRSRKQYDSQCHIGNNSENFWIKRQNDVVFSEKYKKINSEYNTLILISWQK